MELHFRKLGKGEPLIILHGLFGSSDNWFSVGRELSGDFEVFLVDLRNHGQSPHNELHNYEVLSEDVAFFIDQHHIDKAHIIGHSMGGKTTLQLGLRHPDKVNKMIIVDISPFRYPVSNIPPGLMSHDIIIKAMQAVDPSSISNRDEADAKLKESISSAPVRQFLLKNLKRSSEGTFKWILNLPVLSDNLHEIYAGLPDIEHQPSGNIPVFPLLFIKGQRSEYIRAEDQKSISNYFPHAEIKTIQNAGHWVHAEQPSEFLSIVKNFLKK